MSGRGPGADNTMFWRSMIACGALSSLFWALFALWLFRG